MATHSSILAWKIQWTEEPGRLYRLWTCKELDMTEQLHFPMQGNPWSGDLDPTCCRAAKPACLNY